MKTKCMFSSPVRPAFAAVFAGVVSGASLATHPPAHNQVVRFTSSPTCKRMDGPAEERIIPAQKKAGRATAQLYQTVFANTTSS